jgi:hypothetical protein
VSSGASLSLPDGLFAPHELVRELGARSNPAYALRHSGVSTGGKPLLAVGERYVGAGKVGADGEDLARDARRIATLASPNLARVREVVVRGEDLVVVGEFVEGEKLQELWRPDKLPLEIALRVVVDALAGVGALHNLRDAKQQPMKLAHGELSPATIVLGLDGIARVLYGVSRRSAGVEPESASSGYLAPEVASGDPYDARADVFSAGVLLWEALSERRLFPEPDPKANARRVRSDALPIATVPEKATWAKGLIQVAAKALSAEPDKRWPTAAVMAAELRKAAGLKLAPASTAAAFARSAFGERVKMRRESLEGRSIPSRAPRSEPGGASAAAPSQSTSPPQEPSFLDVELESAIDTVLVAPGIRAPVAEVVELESESLIEAAFDSAAPPPASSAVGGFVVDPFVPPAVPGISPPEVGRAKPPPAPAVTTAPVLMIASEAAPEEPPPPSITGAPHFAAAIDLPPPLPAAPAQHIAAPYLEPPAPEAQAPESDEEIAVARRRRFLILGGVAGLGAVIFLLAAVRLARREPDIAPATLHPPMQTASAADSLALQPPPPPLSVTPSATAAPVRPPPPHTTTPVSPKPTPVVAAAAPHPTPAAATHAPATAKPRTKPTFDPNSL